MITYAARWRPRDWNAHSYDASRRPSRNGARPSSRAWRCDGDETVLDAGAGTGRVTEMVLERLPRGRSSPSTARRRWSSVRASAFRPTASRVICSGPARRSSCPSGWTRRSRPRHSTGSPITRRCSHGSAAPLRDGGQFVAQCGGVATSSAPARSARLARRDAVRRAPRALGQIWHYASAERHASGSSDAGFARLGVLDRAEADDAAAPREFLETVIFAPYLERLPASLRDAFLDAAIGAARRPAGARLPAAELGRARRLIRPHAISDIRGCTDIGFADAGAD